MPEVAETPKFWRCGKCNTPNPWKSFLTNCIGCGAARPANPILIARAPAKQSKPAFPKWVAWLSWAYAAVVVLVLALINGLGDRNLPATILMLIPRWIWVFPLFVLAFLALRARVRMYWILHACVLLLILGPLMGFSMPMDRLFVKPPPGAAVRILTINLASSTIDSERLIKLIEKERIDVICMQEVSNKGLPGRLVSYFKNGWKVDPYLFIATRLPVLGESEIPKFDHAGKNLWPLTISRMRLEASDGSPFGVASIHLPTMRHGFEDLLAGNVEGASEQLNWRWQQLELALPIVSENPNEPILIAGDFNMPSDSAMFRTFSRAYQLGFETSGWGWGYTRPSSMPWVRIDHILGSGEWWFKRTWIGPDVGSDHLPVLAEVVLAHPPEKRFEAAEGKTHAPAKAPAPGRRMPSVRRLAMIKGLFKVVHGASRPLV